VVLGEQLRHRVVAGHVLPLVAYRQDCYVNQEHGLKVGFVAEPAGPTHYLVVDGELYVRA